MFAVSQAKRIIAHAQNMAYPFPHGLIDTALCFNIEWGSWDGVDLNTSIVEVRRRPEFQEVGTVREKPVLIWERVEGPLLICEKEG
jgi:hypothetical protein